MAENFCGYLLVNCGFLSRFGTEIGNTGLFPQRHHNVRILRSSFSWTLLTSEFGHWLWCWFTNSRSFSVFSDLGQCHLSETPSFVRELTSESLRRIKSGIKLSRKELVSDIFVFNLNQNSQDITKLAMPVYWHCPKSRYVEWNWVSACAASMNNELWSKITTTWSLDQSKRLR